MDEKLMTLPVIALRGLTVLPEMIQHFDISRDKSISAVEHAMVGEQKVFLVTQRQIEEEDPDASGLFQIGTIARIKQLVKIPGRPGPGHGGGPGKGRAYQSAPG